MKEDGGGWRLRAHIQIEQSKLIFKLWKLSGDNPQVMQFPFLFSFIYSHIPPPLLHSLPVYHLYSVTCHSHSSYIVGALSQSSLTSFSFGSPLTGVHFYLVVVILASYIYFWISSDSLVECSQSCQGCPYRSRMMHESVICILRGLCIF